MSSHQNQHFPTKNKHFYLGEMNDEETTPSRRVSQGILQIVPETPLVQSQRQWTPSTTDRRLNFSCESKPFMCIYTVHYNIDTIDIAIGNGYRFHAHCIEICYHVHKFRDVWRVTPFDHKSSI